MWAEIIRFVSIFDVGTLYFTGDSKVTWALSNGAVRDVVMIYPEQPTQLGWIPMLKLFGNNLKSFFYDAGPIGAPLYHFPSKSDIELLGNNLESVTIRSDGGEHAFWSTESGTTQIPPIPVPLEEMTPLDIGKLWPRLHTLDLAQYSPHRAHDFGDALKTLPKGVTRLSLASTVYLGANRLQLLSSHLVFLKLSQCLIPCDHLKWLPRSLEHLRISEVIAPIPADQAEFHTPSGTPFSQEHYKEISQNGSIDIEAFDDFPRQLSTLRFGVRNTCPAECIVRLPPSLVTLKILNVKMNKEWFTLMKDHLPKLSVVRLEDRSSFDAATEELPHLSKILLRGAVYLRDHEKKEFVLQEDTAPSYTVANDSY